MTVITMDLRKIIWLASYPKSGNTWARAFLNSYVTQVTWDMNAAYGQVVTGDSLPWAYQAVSPWPIQQMPQWGLAVFRIPSLLHAMAAKNWNPLFLKTHHAKVKLGEYALIPPELTRSAVYLVRDPRDACVSWAHHSKSDSTDDAIKAFTSPGFNLRQTSGKWDHVVGSWSEHVESWTADNEDVDTTVIRYEDMLDQPREAFHAILEGCGFQTIDPERLDHAIELSSFNLLRTKEDEEGFKERRGGTHFFRQGKSGSYLDDRSWCRKWLDWLTRQPDQHRLSSEQVREIESHLGDAMEALGYSLTTTTLTELIGV